MNPKEIEEREQYEDAILFDEKNRDKILTTIKMIKEDPRGITISEIASKTGLNKNTVRKYALILAAGGYIEERSCGHTKVFTISNRVPITSVMDYAKEGILIIDEDNKIAYFNEFFKKFMKLDKNCLKLLIMQNEVKTALQRTAITGFTEKEIEYNTGQGLKIPMHMRFVSVNSFDGGKKTVIYVTLAEVLNQTNQCI